MWAAWIGPAIIAAAISALVTAAGWFVADRQSERREGLRRRERRADLQTALLAEIRAGRHRIGSLEELNSIIDEALGEADQSPSSHDPFRPSSSKRSVQTFTCCRAR